MRTGLLAYILLAASVGSSLAIPVPAPADAGLVARGGTDHHKGWKGFHPYGHGGSGGDGGDATGGNGGIAVSTGKGKGKGTGPVDGAGGIAATFAGPIAGVEGLPVLARPPHTEPPGVSGE